MFHYYIIFILIGLLFSCTDDSNFSGSTGTSKKKQQVSENVKSAPATPKETTQVENIPPIEQTNTATITATGTTVVISTLPQPTECKINLDYSPEDVQCSIGANESNVWWSVEGWANLLSQFVDKTASWISPLAAVDGGHGAFCPYAQAQKMIYVSYIKIESPGSYFIEAIMDDIGTARLWKDASASKEVFQSAPGSQVKQTINLEKGFYSIIVEATDVGQGAQGMIMSMADSSGNIIKHSLSDGNWCIFRVSVDTDIKTYVPDAAGCRLCFTGVSNQ